MKTEAELLAAAQAIEGLSFRQLSARVSHLIPESSLSRKGWVGCAIEAALGGQANSRPEPDFASLGIELKTLPLKKHGKPAESTFVSSIALLTLHQETWQTSSCFAKLRRVLWVLVEGDRAISFSERRIGPALLWSPSVEDKRILEQDWSELTWLIVSGRIDEVHAGLGEYLQVRPKAADGKALRDVQNAEGQKQKTLPRGFYLRARFTEKIIQEQLVF